MCAQISDFLPLITDKEKDNSSNFRDTLNKYLYHWPLFVIGLIFAFAMAFVYLKIAEPTYTVKASLIIKDEKKDPDEKAQLEELELSNSSKLAENEIEVLKSHNLINQVVNDLQLMVAYRLKGRLKTEDLYKRSPVVFKLLDTTGNVEGKFFKVKIKDDKSFFLVKSDGELREFSFDDILKNSFGSWKLEPTADLEKFKGDEITITLSNLGGVVAKYQKAIDAVLPDKLAPTIELTLTDGVEQRGKDVLNLLINTYNNAAIAEKNRLTQRTLDFLDNRIRVLAGELNNSERDVEGYRSSNGLTDISSQSKAYIENMQSNDNKLNEVNVQLNVIDGIEQNLNSSENILNASASLGVAYPSLNSLIEKLSSLQSQRDKLLATTGEGNPIFDPINRQIKTTKADIKSNIQSIKSSLITTRNQLQSYNAKFESTIRDVPVQERNLTDRTRQQTIKETLYTYLLQKREEVSFNYAAIVPDARVVDYAYASSAKSTQQAIVYGIACLLGLILPAGFMYTRNAVNNRIVTRKEIEEITGSVFAELSYDNNASTLILGDRSNGLVAEEFRSLRTNLHYLNSEHKKGWITLFTSSISNEGKSFICSNLGLFLASSGKKTIILEMDLRLPKISKTFGLSGSNCGISDYLMGESKIADIIQSSRVHPKLDIIGSGSLTHDPSELLGQPEIDTLMDWLRLNYDYILIDTPPVNLVTDAKILSRTGNATFYIIRQGYTYKSLIPFIKSLYKEQQFPDMKIIFNGVEKGRYGYGYSYGNEYYQEINKTKKKRLKIDIKNLIKRF